MHLEVWFHKCCAYQYDLSTAFVFLIPDFKEFICSLSVTTRGTIDEKLKWAFQIYDIDGNGFITQNEMLSIVKSVQRMVGAMTDKRLSSKNIISTFEKMDKNNDGQLSLEEFMIGAKEDETFVQMLQAYSASWKGLEGACQRVREFPGTWFSGIVD